MRLFTKMRKVGLHHYKLRKKECKLISKYFDENYGISIGGEMEKFEFDYMSVIAVDNEPLILEYKDRYYFTVYGIMKLRPKDGWVVVDEGAMPYIMRGADVMKPGIVDFDEKIKAGDFVYVESKIPIAVGIALVDGVEMKEGRGKAVKNIHHLKDKIWNYFFVKKHTK